MRTASCEAFPQSLPIEKVWNFKIGFQDLVKVFNLAKF